MQAGSSRHGLPTVPALSQKAACLLLAPLAEPQLGESDGGPHPNVAEPSPRGGASQAQCPLGVLPATDLAEKVAVSDVTEAEQGWRIIVWPGRGRSLKHAHPLFGAAQVAASLAGSQGAADDLTGCKDADLSTADDGHRLINPSCPFFDHAQAHLCQTQVGQRLGFEVQVIVTASQIEGCFSLLGQPFDICHRATHKAKLDPSALHAVALPLQHSCPPRTPPPRAALIAQPF